MTTFDEGLCYLGVDFSRTRPAVDPHHDIKGRPNLDKVVYVGRDGARLHVTKGRLIVDGASSPAAAATWGSPPVCPIPPMRGVCSPRPPSPPTASPAYRSPAPLCGPGCATRWASCTV